MQLAERFTVVATDLRGCGASSKPRSAEPYGFRAMGRDQLSVMSVLGFDRFYLFGHELGGRTAHRKAPDAGHRLESLTLMDIVPTHHLLGHLDRKVASAYHHAFFLAQPAPLPESMILSYPDRFFVSCLLGWRGARLSDFPSDELSAYRAAWRNLATVGAMCDDYRAAIRHDFTDGAADLGRRVDGPAFVLYGSEGAMARAYDVPATRVDRLAVMPTGTVEGGHFFVYTAPGATAAALLEFLA